MNDMTKRIQEMIKALKQNDSSPGGIKALTQMLGNLDRRTEQQILSALDKQDPMLAKEIRDHYFTFEDLVYMENKVLRRALEDVHRTTLAVALKGTSDTLQEKVFFNVSERAAMRIKEDMELMGPKPRVLVEEAQREVTKVLRQWKNVIL